MSRMDRQSRREALRTMAALTLAPVAVAKIANLSGDDSANTMLASGQSPGAPSLVGLGSKGRVIAGGFVDDGSSVGHAIRDGHWQKGGSRASIRTSVAIVGGGIGGLSAGWHLDSLGLNNWLLLEMNTHTGGNARSTSAAGPASSIAAGRKAPWGAHYVPVPAADAVHVRRLMRELGLLDADGQWDERTLCHSPQERIWQYGRWHEGIEPLDALSRNEREQFARFDASIAEWRATGMFKVPGAPGHEERERALADGGNRARLARDVQQLDSLTADAWLRANGYTVPALRWLVEYGMKDDYACSLTQASAWAAIQYFAGRDADEQGPLTWPEGNDFVAAALTRKLNGVVASDGTPRIRTGEPVGRVARSGNRWIVDTPTAHIEAEAIIWAAPLFVLPHVTDDVRPPISLEYAPWVVANIVLDRWPAERGFPLSWDNVIYGSQSLGYVNADHQLLSNPSLPTVWTWYHAMVGIPAAQARQELLKSSWETWRDLIVSDLSLPHHDIGRCIQRVDVMRWGHAMPRPVPGVLQRVATLNKWKPGPGFFIGHSDMSGLSLFEEAQWHGIRAARAAAERIGKTIRGNT